MDLKRHFTHYDVRADVRRFAQDVVSRFGGSWNTYKDHPEGMNLDATSVDHWGNRGRGHPLLEHEGDAMVAYILGQTMFRPIRWLIWWGWIWTPKDGWLPYNGWQGLHKDRDAHVHVTYY